LPDGQYLSGGAADWAKSLPGLSLDIGRAFMQEQSAIQNALDLVLGEFARS